MTVFLFTVSMALADSNYPRATELHENNAEGVGAHKVAEGPVGTATALLLSLGAGTLAYKVRKNRKQD